MEVKTKSRLFFSAACLLIGAAGYTLPDMYVQSENTRLDTSAAQSAAAVAPIVERRRTQAIKAAQFTADLSRQNQAITAAHALLKYQGFVQWEAPVELLDQEQGLHVPVLRNDTLPEYKTASILELAPGMMIYRQDVGIWAKKSLRGEFSLQRLRCERIDDDTPTKAGTRPFICKHHNAGAPIREPSDLRP